VIAALKAGYRVICEKALTISSNESIQIEKVLNEYAGYLAVTFNYSGYPMVRELRRIVCDGGLGKLQQIHIEMPQESFLRVNSNPQNWRRIDYAIPTVSLDLGVHVFHLVDFLSGGMKPVALVGEQASYGEHNVIDNVYSIAQFENSLIVNSWWGKTALGHRNGLRLRVFGKKGSAEWYQMEPELLRLADNDGHNQIIDRSSGDAKKAQEQRYNRFKAGHPSGFVEAFANLYADIAEEIHSLSTGGSSKSPYVFGARSATEGLKILELISESSEKREWIDFKS
jgi:predicted dehydrogenase